MHDSSFNWAVFGEYPSTFFVSVISWGKHTKMSRSQIYCKFTKCSWTDEWVRKSDSSFSLRCGQLYHTSVTVNKKWEILTSYPTVCGSFLRSNLCWSFKKSFSIFSVQCCHFMSGNIWFMSGAPGETFSTKWLVQARRETDILDSLTLGGTHQR